MAETILSIILNMNPPVPMPHGACRTAQAEGQTTLGDLRPGERATVTAVCSRGSLRGRLLEMGFVSGTDVRMVRFAPLADPLEVELHGYHLSLRRAEADTVLVERV